MSENFLIFTGSVIGGIYLAYRAPLRDKYKDRPYFLTTEEAKQRAANISEVTYYLFLNLQKGLKFWGYCKITFDLRDPSEEVWLDFNANEILEYKVNGVKSMRWEMSKLFLDNLQKGKNTVEVLYWRFYSNDGCGLHRFKDESDDTEYLYTQFESFYANRMFPCFDQPNIKSVLDLVVRAPDDWKVISNEPVLHHSSVKNSVFGFGSGSNTKFHTFSPTKKISTYLYAVCAGPYYEYRHKYSIPLGLYCRQSLSKWLNPQIYMDWTIAGFEFYQAFFKIPYPFSKYDQIFVPEFNAGAMENVGCVTFKEIIIIRDATSKLDVSRFCNVFLHEMAHMWFGNLVTMDWWDDLWLNESFATFVAHLAQSIALKDPQVWDLFLRMKNVAYNTDLSAQTHPISLTIHNTAEAESLFNAISYGKGSAVLKQLYHVLGHEGFQEGINRYLTQHAWGNTNCNDFIRAMGPEYESWAYLWLKTSGVNSLAIELKNEEGKVKDCIIKQRGDVLRRHKFNARFMDAKMNLIGEFEFETETKENTSSSKIIGTKTPACIIPNTGDYGYFIYEFDTESLNILKEKLNCINSSLERYSIWVGLFRMVKNYRISGYEFLEFVVSQFVHESVPHIGQFVLEFASGLLSTCPTWELKEQISHRIFLRIIERIEENPTPEYINMLFSFLLSSEDILKAKSWLESPLFPLNQSRRWSIIKAYAKIKTDAKDLVSAELANDNSDEGQLAALYCESAYPEPTHKEIVWSRLIANGPNMTRYQRNAAFNGFFNENQYWNSDKFFDEFFEHTKTVVLGDNIEFIKDWCMHWMPCVQDEERLILKIDDLLSNIPENLAQIKNVFLNRKENIGITLKLREVSSNYLGLS